MVVFRLIFPTPFFGVSFLILYAVSRGLIFCVFPSITNPERYLETYIKTRAG
jgi:hypothetical protein